MVLMTSGVRVTAPLQAVLDREVELMEQTEGLQQLCTMMDHDLELWRQS